MITKSQFLSIISSDIAYEQNMVYAIDENGREHLMKNFADTLANKDTNSIKIERMEAYNSEIFSYCLELEDMYEHNGPITCHLFYAEKNAHSFKKHTDPDNVVIYCCEGMKTIAMEGHTMGGEPVFTLKEGAILHIPANTLHQAFNEHEALTLSFGLEKFIEDKMNSVLVSIP
tara:strand:- start:2431 stop:2949 length:519 start_codon:yes stop_codon:yes gene_type:complete